MKRIQIQDLQIPELEVYTSLLEPQLKHYDEPEPGLFIAETDKVIRRALDAGYEPVSVLAESDPSALFEKWPDLPAYLAERKTLEQLTGYALTRGVLCAMRRKPLPAVSEVLEGASLVVVLERVMNPTNVGAIVRSAAALGADAVLFTDGCTDPLYRRAIRVSMGTIFQIPWTFIPDWPDSLTQLKNAGFMTAAMALTDQSVSLDRVQILPERKVALIMGTEGEGLMEETIAACDLTIRIPMAHGVDSLNVAAAGAVAVWALRRLTDAVI